jgi:hypothetical protein
VNGDVGGFVACGRSGPTTLARMQCMSIAHDHVQTDACIAQHRGANQKPITSQRRYSQARDALTTTSPTEASKSREEAQ